MSNENSPTEIEKYKFTNQHKYVRVRTNKHSSHWHYVIMVSLSYHSRGRVQ